MRAGALVRLYPRAWRERYGEEFEELLGSRGIGLRLIVDIVFGALDARLAPQPQVAGAARDAGRGGRVMAVLRAGCGTVSTGQEIRYAVLAAGATVAYALVYVWLKHTVGQNVWVRPMGNTVIAVPSLTYVLLAMRHWSLRARLAFCGGVLALVFLIELLW